ncbi:MAG: excinuclease ABC subunit UvrA, partial [Gemmatimonadaceae bacterium]
DMPIEEASEFFAAIPAIARHLTTLVEVGLGYVRLGQPAPTLSGGEAQRVKLASELQKRSTGRTVYVLDEPTTGLHFEDVRMLMSVLHRLVDRGNTVLVIEHNLDVIKTADWIIDLGPEGGLRGGDVVAAGTPEDVAEVKESYTGQYLKPLLARKKTGNARRGIAVKEKREAISRERSAGSR